MISQNWQVVQHRASEQRKYEMSDSQPKLHHLGEFLSRTGLSRSSAYREIAKGNLKVTRIGRSVRISESEICRFIEQAEGARK